MTSVFDGMAGTLIAIFGGPVTYLPEGGAARVIQSVFREDPIEVRDADGAPVLTVGPTWSVEAHLVPEIARLDRITPANGKTYEILNFDPSGSPASDARLICDLHEVPA